MRLLLFMVFFGIGAAALSGSILCDDLLRYYHGRQVLQAEQELLRQLKSLNTDYDILLQQLEENPDLIKRAAPVTLGVEPNDANTIYPRPTAEQLNAARKVLTRVQDAPPVEPAIPQWLSRCGEPRRRVMLFFAGAGLVLISLVCFGPAKQTSQNLKIRTRKKGARRNHF